MTEPDLATSTASEPKTSRPVMKALIIIFAVFVVLPAIVIAAWTFAAHRTDTGLYETARSIVGPALGIQMAESGVGTERAYETATSLFPGRSATDSDGNTVHYWFHPGTSLTGVDPSLQVVYSNPEIPISDVVEKIDALPWTSRPVQGCASTCKWRGLPEHPDMKISVWESDAWRGKSPDSYVYVRIYPDSEFSWSAGQPDDSERPRGQLSALP